MDQDDRRIIYYFKRYVTALSLFEKNIYKNEAFSNLIENKIKPFLPYFDQHLDQLFLRSTIKFPSLLLEVANEEDLEDLFLFYKAKLKIYKGVHGENENYNWMSLAFEKFQTIYLDCIEFRGILNLISFDSLSDENGVITENHKILKTKLEKLYTDFDSKKLYDIASLRGV